MEIKKDELLFILRYSNKMEKECVKKHIEVLNKDKFVWWGKCGSRSSQKNINLVLNEKNPKLILYSTNDKCFICDIDEITYEKPKHSYPKYYDDVFDDEFYPTTYFKIHTINELDKMYLEHLVVNSTKRDILDLMINSMTTQCIAKSKENFKIEWK